MIIENARIGISKDFNVIWANIEDQDSDVIKKLGRGKTVGNQLLYEYNDHLIYLSTDSFKTNNVLVDILNSQFAKGFGQVIGERLPDIIDALARNIGEQNIQGQIESLITKRK